ncbi:MAG: DUF1549 and DUF1553 domain-containing protein [Verrucomicrobiales bacterium]|nr:DUF1549 and DUF1553 domain-containing protein [Verrucomicrobiales bacterium]
MSCKRSVFAKVHASLSLGILLAVLPATAEEVRPHWAYQPLAQAEIPSTKSTNWSRSPVDAFILAKLEANALEPAPEADKRTLLRRVYFDLSGLPPTPEETRAFLSETSPRAYEEVVDRLLASPRYGERWARHWMDAVHFAETHGHDQDRIRTNAWPYRDYLIASFNQDKAYARFVQEQVAGDALFPNDPQATIALGLIAAGPWDESSLRDIREDTIDRQIGRYLDRDDMLTTVMQTFTSTTVQCARCHDHKFDPIPQRDYYALQAVFAGVDRANRVYDAEPGVHRLRQSLLRERKRIELGDRAVLLSAETQRRVGEWERAIAEHKVQWTVIEPQTFVSVGGATLTRQADGSLLASGRRPERDTYTITATAPLARITAVKLEVLADPSLPKNGPGRPENGNLHLSEFELLIFEPGTASARPVALTHPSADFDQPGWTIDHALDRNEKTAWGLHPKAGQSHQAVFELAEPLGTSSNVILTFVLKQLHGDGHLIGRPRLSVTDARAPTPVRVRPADIEQILGVPLAQRTDDQRANLAAFSRKDSIRRELAGLPKPSLTYAAASEFEPDGGLKPAAAPRPVHMLGRGDIKKPIEPARPGALSCVSKLAARFELKEENDESGRRAALARWLTEAENPLTWRSIVNRVWHHHFGRGLVETPNDFGKMGSPPSHLELLDWLALWFRDDARGSIKQLHRLIVTSATYRQAAAVPDSRRTTANGSDSELRTPNSEPHPRPRPVAAAIDAENRLLWRMNRARLDAEQVRDTILQMAGCLDLRMGGPGDMQFDLQPGIHVTPRVDYTKFDVSGPAARRRSVYRFLFRTLPDPFMDALDCPAGDQLTPARNASVTVQQALALWNNAFVAYYAGRFAERLESLAHTRPDQVRLACEFALGRLPNREEEADFVDYTEKHGVANLCRLILNSNEFMFVN